MQTLPPRRTHTHTLPPRRSTRSSPRTPRHPRSTTTPTHGVAHTLPHTHVRLCHSQTPRRTSTQPQSALPDSTDSRTRAHPPHPHGPTAYLPTRTDGSPRPHTLTLTLPTPTNTPTPHTDTPQSHSPTPTGTHVPPRPHRIRTRATCPASAPPPHLAAVHHGSSALLEPGFEDVALMLPVLVLGKDPAGGNARVGEAGGRGWSGGGHGQAEGGTVFFGLDGLAAEQPG